jgi:hypothetical protein
MSDPGNPYSVQKHGIEGQRRIDHQGQQAGRPDQGSQGAEKSEQQVPAPARGQHDIHDQGRTKTEQPGRETSIEESPEDGDIHG